MIKDQTIDEALIEIMRTKKALEVLRKARKESKDRDTAIKPVGLEGKWHCFEQQTEHAAVKRASMDLTRKLADLRAGR